MTNQPNLPDLEPNGQKSCSTEIAGKPNHRADLDADMLGAILPMVDWLHDEICFPTAEDNPTPTPEGGG